jgi:DnaK suppressor protein
MTRWRSFAAHARELKPVQIRPHDELVDRLPALRLALEQQHRFRSEQLALLVEQESEGGVDPSEPEDGEAVRARREVDAVLAVGARRALTDIELALARMGTGRYGFCRSCGTSIPLALLDAIPKTTLCLACRYREERVNGQLAGSLVPEDRGSARRGVGHAGSGNGEDRPVAMEGGESGRSQLFSDRGRRFAMNQRRSR